MSGLSFLAPDATDEAVAHTPMEHLARAAGATFERRMGWNVAVSYAGDQSTERRRLAETVGVVDRSQLTKLEVQARPGMVANIALEVGDGVVLEPGRAGRTAGVWWCPVTPSRMLLLAEPGSTVKAALTDTVGVDDPAVTIVDVTCGLAGLALVGPGCRELLARFCAIDARLAVTPVTGFRPGSIARTPGYLLCEREDQLLLLVGWAFGEYLYEVVADSARHLGGGPVGADALSGRLDPQNA
jgi:glycine cleavage system aminomethyltransferase T